jgi:hypothetical protein
MSPRHTDIKAYHSTTYIVTYTDSHVKFITKHKQINKYYNKEKTTNLYMVMSVSHRPQRDTGDYTDSFFSFSSVTPGKSPNNSVNYTRSLSFQFHYFLSSNHSTLYLKLRHNHLLPISILIHFSLSSSHSLSYRQRR